MTNLAITLFKKPMKPFHFAVSLVSLSSFFIRFPNPLAKSTPATLFKIVLKSIGWRMSPFSKT